MFAMCGAAHAAVAVKKAESVAPVANAGTANVASLVPGVLGLVTDVMALNKAQNELTAECVPTSAEITFVENMVKEWAKVGEMTSAQAAEKLKREPCTNSTGNCYATDVQVANTPGLKPKFNVFRTTADNEMVWADFPKPGLGEYCKTGMPLANCSGKDEVRVSDIYEVFAIVDFGPADYLPNEVTMAAKLLDKAGKCSRSAVNAKKAALWGEFLQKTAGNIGQKTNTGTIMEQVGAITSGGGVGALGGLGGIATQLIGGR